MYSIHRAVRIKIVSVSLNTIFFFFYRLPIKAGISEKDEEERIQRCSPSFGNGDLKNVLSNYSLH